MAQDCKIEPRSQKFTIFEKIHILGAIFSIDEISKVPIFDTIPSGSNMYISSAITDTINTRVQPHGIYNNMAIHTDSHPTRGLMNTVDYWSLSHQESGVASENTFYKQDSAYLNDINYSSMLKDIEYTETQFIKSTNFYEIPSQNILSMGVIYNKTTHKYEYCLIDEGSEKCNYTLEARLFTHGEGGSNLTVGDGLDDYVFTDRHKKSVGGTTVIQDDFSYGYFLELAGVHYDPDFNQNNFTDESMGWQIKTSIAHKLIFDDYDPTQYDITCPLNPNWHGWRTNNFSSETVSVQDDVRGYVMDTYNYPNWNFKDLRDINLNSSGFQATRYNFFTNMMNNAWIPFTTPRSSFPMNTCNQRFAIGIYPALYKGNDTSIPAGTYNVIGNGSSTQYENDSPYCSGGGLNRYYTCTLHSSIAYNDFSYRYIGSVLSNPNLYEGFLLTCGYTTELHNRDFLGRICCLPEEIVNNNTVPVWSINHALRPGTTIPVNVKPIQTSRAGLDSQGAYGSSATNHGEMLYRVPAKSGSSKIAFNPDYTTTRHHWPSGNGFLYDRDVMLFSPYPDDSNSVWPSDMSLIGNLAGRTENGDVTESSEIEFELFYCANINTPVAAETLLEFGKKLNKKLSHYPTGINRSYVNDLGMSWYLHEDDTIYPADFVYQCVNALEDFTDASIIYGSTVTIDTSQPFGIRIPSGETTNMAYYGNYTFNIQAEVNNVYIWENCGVPVKGSRTLEGIKTIHPYTYQGLNYTDELYSYGHYFIAYFAHKLYLIDETTFNTYMYDAEEFTELVQEIAYNPCDTDYPAGSKTYSLYGDPFKYATSNDITNATAFANLTDGVNGQNYFHNGYTWNV